MGEVLAPQPGGAAASVREAITIAEGREMMKRQSANMFNDHLAQGLAVSDHISLTNRGETYRTWQRRPAWMPIGEGWVRQWHSGCSAS
jgi:hypothetical protein